MLVRYEDFVSAPHTFARRVLAFAGLQEDAAVEVGGGHDSCVGVNILSAFEGLEGIFGPFENLLRSFNGTVCIEE